MPLVVRAPGATGTVSRAAVTWVDLPATVLDLADTEAGRVLDGTSFAPILAGQPQPWRDTQLIHTGRTSDGPEMAWDFQGVRTHRFSLVKRVSDGRVWLLDRRRDPYETRNFAEDSRYGAIHVELSRRLELLVDCTGTECDRSFGQLPRVGAG